MTAPLSLRLAVLAALHVLVALVFLKGFLLTRVELPDISTCTGVSCSSKPAYSKAVVLIVDALRYDFVCDDGSSTTSFRGRFPRTLGLVGAAVSRVKLLLCSSWQLILLL
jgi:phosphatidylinositol glycan class O